MLTGLRKTGKKLYLLLWRNFVIRWRVGSVPVGRKFRIPLFQLMELLWPLLLYIILAALSHKFPPEQKGNTVFRPYAMPSAGFLPFLQTVMCDLGDDDKGGVVSDLPSFPNATVNVLYPVLDEVGSWNVSWTKLCDSLHHLADQRDCLATSTSQDPQCHTPSGGQVPVTCYLRNSTEFQQFLEQNLQLQPDLVDQILSATVDPSQLLGDGGGAIGSELGGVDLSSLLGAGLIGGVPGGVFPGVPGVSSGQSLQFLVCNTSTLEPVLHFPNLTLSEVQSEVCRLSDSQWDELAEEVQRQSVTACDSEVLTGAVAQVVSVQRLVEDSGVFELLQSFQSVGEGGGAGGKGGGCQEMEDGQVNCAGDATLFFCGPTRTRLSRDIRSIMGRFFAAPNTSTDTEDGATPLSSKPHGSDTTNVVALPPSVSVVKVLYTPVSNLTQSIMRKANRTFDTVAQLIALADQVRNCSQFFLDNFDPDSLSGVRQTMVDVIAYRNGVPGSSLGTRYLANLYPNASVADLQRTLNFINASSSNNIWSLMRIVRGVATQAYDSLTVLDWDVFMGVPSEVAMEELFSNPGQQADLNINYVMAGVVFDDPFPSDDDPAGGGVFKNATIRIRTNFTAVVDPTELMEKIWYPGPEDAKWKKAYFSGLVIFLQDMLERAIMEQIVGGRVASPGVYVQRMPYPCYNHNPFVSSLQFALPLTMLFCWLFPIAMTTRAVVREKEVRLKEYMKMMGVGEGLLRLSWFLSSFFTLELSVVGIVLILRFGGILPTADPTIILAYLTVYALSMLSYSFLVSVFFSNANLAACVAALSYFMVFFAHLPILPYINSLSAAVLGLCCLWSPLAFAIGGTYVAQWELQQVGLQWHNIFTTPIADDHLSFLGISLMLVVDIVIYLLLAWYIEGVFPGRYGVAKPWYFPLQPSYWFGQRQYSCHAHLLDWCKSLWHSNHGDKLTLLQDEQESSKLTDLGDEEGAGFVEEESEGLPLGIVIEGLNKTFKTGWLPWKQQKVQAVKNLSVKFYEGQITAFLGHNGAGKTTTLSLLTGLFEPTSGTARVYGRNIRKEMDTIRHSLGICPQHNTLFDELTVEEHLMFYGQMKGLTRAEAKQQLPGWLERVELSGQGNKLAKHLSGGMKRKLSILLAFVGKCRTIILDEPTSGVDPFARQQIWDFLLKSKQKRTIVLCTHHMDEAEMLGDRIAIISQGSLLCCGSFEYLKHKYGRGHRLTLVAKGQEEVLLAKPHTFTVVADVEHVDSDLTEERSSATPPSADQSNTPHLSVPPPSPDQLVVPRPSSPTQVLQSSSPISNERKVIDFVRGRIPGAELVETRGQELHVLLPLLQARPRALAQLFSELDNQKDSLGVSSYGLTACSMEEIFMMLTEKELITRDQANLAETFVPRPSLHLNSQSSSEGMSCETDGGVADGEKDQDKLLSDEDETFIEPGGLLGSERAGVTGNGRGQKVCVGQFYAVLVRRVLHTRGAVVALLVQNVLPLFLIVVGLVIAMALQRVPDAPQLELSPHMFFSSADYNYMFVGGDYNNVTAPMADSFFRPCGVGAHTVDLATDPTSQCYQDNLWQPWEHECPSSNYPQSQYSCQCPADVVSSCNRSNLVSGSVPVCFNGTGTGTRVLNVTESDMEDFSGELQDYLLGSTFSFVRERYGGVSFGHAREDVAEDVDQLNSDPSLTLPFLATYKSAKAWHTIKGYHAAPAFLNTLNNAILRASLTDVSVQEQAEFGIRTFSHPFALTDLEKIIYAVRENIVFLVHPLCVIFSLGFVLAGFCLLLIEERVSGIKHLQVVCGMNRWVYWLSAYCWDLLWYCAFCLVMVIIFVIFREPTYSSAANLPIFLLTLLCYGLASIPWIYMFSFLFQSPATAYVLLFCLNFFTGFAFLLVDFVLVEVNGEKANANSGFLQYTLVWVPFPAYALGRCMMYLSLDLPVSEFVSSIDASSISNPYSKLLPFFLSLLVQSLLYCLVVLLTETMPTLVHKCRGWRRVSLPEPEGEDEDVVRERVVAMTPSNDQDLLVLRNLTKIYGTRYTSQYRLAVNQLCLRMDRGECFGLLGVNGAGKTSTFRMLTGDAHVTAGEAVIGNTQVSGGGASGIKGQVGYCPQVDALIETLTARQQLTFYSRLRGMGGAELQDTVEWMLRHLQLMEYADKPAGTYSGGNRRKLSTAIALLSKPSLILLDEPTAGVDPLARRFLWSVVKNVVGGGQGVVLTTHSMAECEALCSRVGIMVNGSFRCLGSIQQLKLKYGEGYRLKIRLNSDPRPVKTFMQQNIAKAILKEEHCTSLVYQLPGDGLHLSSVYDTMEDARQNLDIKDYSLSQTTLDDVFIHFANEQSEEVGLSAAMATGRHEVELMGSAPEAPAAVSMATLPDLVPDSLEASTPL